jgi:hypothetical protein
MMRWAKSPWFQKLDAMRFGSIAASTLALALTACAGAYHTPSDGRLNTRIIDAYSARDACLAKNASTDLGLSLDAAQAAHAVTLACVPETEKLVEVSNVSGDPAVAENIRKDTEFRAMGYVRRARGEVTN